MPHEKKINGTIIKQVGNILSVSSLFQRQMKAFRSVLVNTTNVYFSIAPDLEDALLFVREKAFALTELKAKCSCQRCNNIKYLKDSILSIN